MVGDTRLPVYLQLAAAGAGVDAVQLVAVGPPVDLPRLTRWLQAAVGPAPDIEAIDMQSATDALSLTSSALVPVGSDQRPPVGLVVVSPSVPPRPPSTSIEHRRHDAVAAHRDHHLPAPTLRTIGATGRPVGTAGPQGRDVVLPAERIGVLDDAMAATTRPPARELDNLARSTSPAKGAGSERFALGVAVVATAMLPLLSPKGPSNTAPEDLLMMAGLVVITVWAGSVGARLRVPTSSRWPS